MSERAGFINKTARTHVPTETLYHENLALLASAGVLSPPLESDPEELGEALLGGAEDERQPAKAVAAKAKARGEKTWRKFTIEGAKQSTDDQSETSRMILYGVMCFEAE